MERVLLTGASGFIGKHIALRLLNAGYSVRGTLRRLDREGEVRAALAPHLIETAGEISFVAADLDTDAGWTMAMEGVSALIHSASPFPAGQPKDPAKVIGPAVEGTERVLKAAAASGVERVVLTSSVAAVFNDNKPNTQQDEADWCDIHLRSTTPYIKSKTLAERAAWEIARARGLKLTTINPGLALGPPLDTHYGTSLALVARLLRGKDPMVLPYGLPVVDVRDVAEMHLRALQRPETIGRRYIGAAGSLSFADMGRALKAAFPDRRVPTREAPGFLIRALGLIDPSIRWALPKLGHLERVSNARAVQEMGMEFIAPKTALVIAAEWLVKHAGL